MKMHEREKLLLYKYKKDLLYVFVKNFIYLTQECNYGICIWLLDIMNKEYFIIYSFFIS